MSHKKVKNIEDIYNLSPMQQGILFHTLYTPEADPYFRQMTFEIDGPLNVQAFKQAWQRVVERHPVLRTFFVWEGRKKPLQIVRRQVTLPWTEYDWRGVLDQEKQLQIFLKEQQKQVISLQTAPLMRLVLIQLADQKFKFVLSYHHILSDGWSLPLLLKEVWHFYEAAIQGKSLRLEVPRPYGEYIVWLEQQDHALAERFWRQTLQGFTAPTPLMLMRAPSGEPSYSTHRIQLSLAMTQALQEIARQNRLTLNTLVQGAWALLLSRYSGDADILFGATVSGRPPELLGVEKMIGLFINTLPVRVNVPAEENLLPWLQKLQNDQLEREQVGFCSLVDMQSWSEVPRGTALFDSLLVFENYPISQETFPQANGLQLRDFRLMEETHYPLTVIAVLREFDSSLLLSSERAKKGTVLQLSMSYDTSRFDHESICRMGRHFQTLLEGIQKGIKSQRIAELALLTHTEHDQLLVEWNNTQTDYPKDKCIHTLFEKQVERTPDAIALVFDDQQLTYCELNARANQVAHYLITQGVGPDVLVGLCVKRSVEMVVGLLGILKAGGAYVPLDPSYPAERLAFMLEDASLSLLLTQEELQESWPPTAAQLICLDSDWPQIGKQSSHNLFVETKPDNLAYVIYTSGSTGTPKGVLVQHDNVVRLLSATEPWFDFNESDVWTLFHSVAFDFSVWEIWGALLYGGRLVVVPYLVSRSPELFYQLLCEQGVTVLNQTPSAFKQLIQYEEYRSEPEALALRFVIFGGEALEFASLAPWFDRHGDSSPQLINMYGITETTVHVTYRPITRADLTQQASLIGEPIPDLQLYILDAHQQLVPIGIPGELYIGGAGVSRGYLNRPALTADRFVPKQILPGHDLKFDSLGSPNDSPRLYRTGDLVRRLPQSSGAGSGDIEYMGRIDNQVKIRGFRIELGEIEAVLAQHPDVRSALVLAQEDKERHRYLVGYIIARHDMSVTISQLRSYLSERLPDYMIPATFIPLDRIPLTANGKVDRQALPQPNQFQSLPSSQYVPPRTVREALLVDIFKDVLNHKIVGVHDNFFTLGGDSILSIQVLTRIKEAGLGLSLQQLFQHQTVYALARVLSESTDFVPKITPFSLISEKDRQRLPADVEDAYPLAALQMGMLFHSEYDLDRGIYHNVSTLKFKMAFSAGSWHLAIQKVIERHPILRTSFDLSHYSTPLQLVHRSGVIRLEIEDLRHLSSHEQESRLDASFETEKKIYFEWHRPSLLRFHIHLLDQDIFQLTLAEHHAILDGWSVASLMTELFQNYHALVKQLPSDGLLPLEQHYRSFLALERAAINDEANQTYWQHKLADTTRLTLHSWYAEGLEKNRERSEQGTLEVEIDATLSASIKAFARSAGVPVKSALLAAHMRVLNVLGNQSDVLTGLVMNGRPEEAEGTQVLGLFLNTLPFRLHLDGGTWQELAQEVFEAECELLPVRRYPLAELQRQQGGHDLFKVIFNFVHFHLYEKMSVMDGVEFLGGQFFQETNFGLAPSFSLNPFTGQIGLQLDYDLDEFPFEQIKTIAQYYKRVLMAMVDDPKALYNDISLLSQSERHQILVSWNDTATDYPQDKCIHQLFEQHAAAERTPNAVAVVAGCASITYRELNARANQLAHYLIAQGVGPDMLVGICLERSVEMIVGLLGILKAGGAYLPLDPAYPKERLAYMLSDAEVQVLVTQESLVHDNLVPINNERLAVVCLHTDWEIISQQSDANPISRATPDDLAYVIYTSGSTGMPKGVAIEHRSLVNAYLAWEDAYQLRSRASSHLQMASFSFDVFSGDLVRALCSGGKLVLCPREWLLVPEKLYKLMLSEAVDCAEFVPVVVKYLIEYLKETKQNLHFMRLLVVGSDSWDMKDYRALHRFCGPQTRLINSYGVTEATIDSCYFEKTQLNLADERPVPIGRSFGNVQIYILDDHKQPVPIGVPGELHIGGAGLGRGYLNRPELTKEKFIANPFGRGRLYKTGDLCRYLPDGNIELLGRTDYQVKIRGFRLELGQIEAVARKHEAVREAVVIVREETTGKRLVAYVVCKQSVSSSTLRTYLLKKLPDYMIPSAFVQLDALPLTPNGKVNRRALPAPDESSVARSSSFVAPRNETEEMLAAIWRELLRVEQVGIHDNFFELGGHSLLATQVISRIREALEIKIPLRHLFESPTVASLAERIEDGRITKKLQAFSTLSIDQREEFVL